MASSLTLPNGYYTYRGRDCVELHHDDFGLVQKCDCYAEACYAAQEHDDTLADEASEAAAAASDAAYEATLETLHSLIASARVHTNAGDDAARGERRAIKAVLTAIDTISMAPVGARLVAAQSMGAR